MGGASNRNRVFISCVSAEFEVLRDKLRLYLQKADCDVKVQEEFRQVPVDTVEKLAGYIRDCAAVIHIVGGEPGSKAHPEAAHGYLQAEAEFLASKPEVQAELGDFSDLTYTQWEAFLALHHDVPLFVYRTAAAISQQTHLDRLKLGRRYGSKFDDPVDLLGQLIGDLRKIIPALPAEEAAARIPRPVAKKKADQLVEFGLRLALDTAALLAIYDDCAPGSPAFQRPAATSHFAPTTLCHWIVDQLREAPPGTDGFHPLLRLALHQRSRAYAAQPGDDGTLQELTTWIDEVAESLSTLDLVAEKRSQVDRLTEGQAERRPVLLVRIAPFSETTDPEGQWSFQLASDRYLVKALMVLEGPGDEAWDDRLWDTDPGPDVLTARDRPVGEQPFQQDELQAQVYTWADQCSQRHGGCAVRIEVFLPLKLLTEGVDQWSLPADDWADPQPVGAAHKLVVRSWDRAYSTSIPPKHYQRMTLNWHRRWDLLQPGGNALPAEIIGRNDFTTKLLGSDWALAGLTFQLAAGPDADEARKILVSGAPVVLWRREPDTDDKCDAWRDWLTRCMGTPTVAELCSEVHNTRRNPTDPFAAVISLVYDNPRKSPPDARYRLRQNDLV